VEFAFEFAALLTTRYEGDRIMKDVSNGDAWAGRRSRDAPSTTL